MRSCLMAEMKILTIVQRVTELGSDEIVLGHQRDWIWVSGKPCYCMCEGSKMGGIGIVIQQCMSKM